ncbi:protein Wnt-11 [Kryptolebias marmoratus]|uniref:Protein Wnt n=1 Tax=Kryptolebias marmoratus TaxID=37003 RepID=A0A3Q3AS40_KRYMA|nr:protein Wnt-11 [Kryptolebias marmoratus]XP_017286643.1 protein Wnt-11 [Kryptolebias marmoratus]
MRSSSHALPLGVLTALLLSQLCSGIKWLTLSNSPVALHINHTQHCKLLPNLVPAQTQLCRTHLEAMKTIFQAAREVKKTCQKTFADMRWNCSSIEIPVDNPKYRPDLDRGTREAAFVYALSTATIIHALARACSSGDLQKCGCAPTPSETPAPDHRWGGCGDNLLYGVPLGSKFVDSPMKLKRSHGNKLMHLHNSEVGRQALRKALVVKCKCHGVSGSCSIRTCWKGLQDLREIAMDLKSRYLSATKVVHRPMGPRKQLVPKDIDIRPVRDTELVYLHSSPDFCSKNDKLGSVGTQDRQCNKTSVGSDSCDLMCCGRGYNPYTEKLVERCHCKYHWCCYVTCKKCERTVERYVCK